MNPPKYVIRVDLTKVKWSLYLIAAFLLGCAFATLVPVR